MGNCDGRWVSTVDFDDDGILDLDALVHEHSGGRRDRIQVACGGRRIVINKRGHVYKGDLVADGRYEGEKNSNRNKKGLEDEPTDGTWTAQQGPGEEGDKGKKKGKKSSKKSTAKAGAKSAKKAGGSARKKSAKATQKRAQKAAKRGTKKAAKSAKKR
jgi:hypothetical protein